MDNKIYISTSKDISYKLKMSSIKVSRKDRLIIRGMLKGDKSKTHTRKEILVTEGVLLSLPLLLTFALYVNLILKSTTNPYAVSENLSPSNLEPMLMFMLFFIVSYSIFLVVMYRKIKDEINLSNNGKNKKSD